MARKGLKEEVFSKLNVTEPCSLSPEVISLQATKDFGSQLSSGPSNSYYGDLAGDRRRTAVGKRTPRIPLGPVPDKSRDKSKQKVKDIKATEGVAVLPKHKNAKRKYSVTSNDCHRSAEDSTRIENVQNNGFDSLSSDEKVVADVLQALVDLCCSDPCRSNNIDAGKTISGKDKSGVCGKQKERQSIDDLDEGPVQDLHSEKKVLTEKLSPNSCLFASGKQVPEFSQLNDETIILPSSASEAPDGKYHEMPISKRRHRKRRKEKKEPKLVASLQKEQDEVCNPETELKMVFAHCMSCPLLRRWCAYEWFYSLVDFLWFARIEFVVFLNQVNLGHVPELTRTEWGILRKAIGKPRRFSKKYILEQRYQLEEYRDHVRTIYSQLHSGVRDDLPIDLLPPLSVGQCVVARHPETGELYDGSIVSVHRDCCEVMFDKSDLGTEIVPDIYCMPSKWENMPEVLRWLATANAGKLDVSTEDETTRLMSPFTPYINSDEPFKSCDAWQAESGFRMYHHHENDNVSSHVASYVMRSCLKAEEMVTAAFEAVVHEDVHSHGMDDEKSILRNSEILDLDQPIQLTSSSYNDDHPSNLISACAFTVLAIKDFSENRCPPADVAKVLEHAAAMLQPSSPQNLALYWEIEMYMGIIKNQMLALIPDESYDHPARPSR